MDVINPLPPGQRDLGHFPRYGLWQFARHHEKAPFHLRIEIGGNVGAPFAIDEALLGQLPRVELTSDFHCVTTWSRRGINWSGVRFRDLYDQIVVPEGRPAADVRYVLFRSRDNYRTYLLLEDALAEDVLLADRIDGTPLAWEHGAPLRLVAPAHYGFKSAKHLRSIEFCPDLESYRSPALHWTEHSRARVALEERGKLLPGWLYRYLFRPVIPTVLWVFRRAAKKRKA